VKRSEFFITLTVLFGVIMAMIDMTIVNVALPTIAGNLGCSIDDVAWVATGYILAAVITMPLNGWLTAYFGRKTFYAGSIVLFTVASLLCGFAHSIVQLTLFRILQGFGGGSLQPTAQAILFETFGAKRSGPAMAMFGLGVMTAPALGPILGGYIIDNATWPLIFLINVPIGILTFFMALSFIPTPHYIARVNRGIDWAGLGLLAAGLASLQYVLERGQHEDWWDSTTIVVLASVSVVALAIFGIKTLRDRYPLVNLRVFRVQSFALANIVMFVVGFGLFGSELIVPLFFQSILGMTALDAGMALLPGAIATAVSMIVSGRLTGKIDPRILPVTGASLAAWANWQLGGLTQYAGADDTLIPRTVLGFGLGCLFVPMTTIMLANIPREELAGATGIAQLVRQLGGSLGIAAITTLLTRQTAVAWSELAGGITQSHGVSTPVLMSLLSQAASVSAYDYVFRVSAILFVLAVPLIFMIRRRHVPSLVQAPVALAAD
jgi:DHA2 family multidrug resistance protein